MTLDVKDIVKTRLFDKYIDCQFLKDGEVVTEIKTSVTGIKPAIKFTWNRVPGQFTYKCRLDVTNWFTNTPLYEFEEVVVTAGYMYESRKSCRFHCSIFNAYRPSGGPDTAAVFECIVAKAEASLLQDVSYALKYYNLSATVQDVLQACASKLNLELVANASAAKLLQVPFSPKQIEESFDTGYQVVNYLKTRLSDIVKERKESIDVIVFDTYLCVLHYTEDNKVEPSDDDLKKLNVSSLSSTEIPIIDQTTDVTWTAGTLSITAPWNPAVTPGKVFYCEPSLYTGSTALPNQVARKLTHKDPSNCYYCVTQQVAFATNSSTNDMKILAVRMSNSPASKLISNALAKSDAEQLSEKAKSEYTAYIKKKTDEYVQSLKQKEIVIGKDTPQVVEAAWKSAWTPSGYNTYMLTSKDSLDTLVHTYFKSTVHCEFQGQGFQFPSYYLGYALIPLATYHQYLKSRNPKFELNPNAPCDLICDGSHYAVIPTISDYKQLNNDTQLSGMLENLAEEQNKKGNKQVCQMYKVIAHIVKEGTIL